MTMDYQGTLPSAFSLCLQIHPSIQLHTSTAVSTTFLKFAEGRKAKRVKKIKII